MSFFLPKHSAPKCRQDKAVTEFMDVNFTAHLQNFGQSLLGSFQYSRNIPSIFQGSRFIHMQ